MIAALQIRKHSAVPEQRNRHRSGYALLVCLLVAAISGMALLGILDIARFETLEVSAKQRTAAATWGAKAGVEKAIAMLIADPNLRGSLKTFKLTGSGETIVDAEILEKDKSIIVKATASVGGISKSQEMIFTLDQLTTRIKNR